MIHFTIPDRLPGLNEYVNACRSNPIKGGQKSSYAHRICKLGMTKIHGKKMNRIFILCQWFERDKRRDKDNIASARKFILDALQEWDILKNDGWKQIAGFYDDFQIDAGNPRVEVYCYEEGEIHVDCQFKSGTEPSIRISRLWDKL